MRRRVILVFCFVLIYALTSGTAFSSAVTHKVKSGDNLYTIAKNYGVTVDQLMNLNSLKTNKLKLGQMLVIKKDAGQRRNQVATRQVEAEPTENDGEFIEYKTRKGDTLDKIARQFNVDKEDILDSNNLSGLKGNLRPGRVLLVPKTSEEPDGEFVTLSTGNFARPWNNKEEKYMLVKVAKSFMGAPYRYGGETVRGLDCSAFVKKIYDIFDVQLPRSAREQFGAGPRISKDALTIGDLVFFKTKRYAKYPTHVGIYIGDGNFIHSSSVHSKQGVKIDTLSADFYSKTYVGAVRVKRPLDENPSEISLTPDGTPSNS
jgi:peptidoglycan DL-endopeptidase LytE